MNAIFLPKLFQRREITNRLATSRSGRITLHLICLLQNPGRRRWHWHGVLREVNALLPRSLSRQTA